MTSDRAEDAAERAVAVCDVLASLVGSDVAALRSYLADTVIPGLSR